MHEDITPALFLHRQYRRMHDELHDRCLDRDMSEDAPAFAAERHYAQPDDAPPSAQELLNGAIGVFVGDVGIRVRHHLSALAVA